MKNYTLIILLASLLLNFNIYAQTDQGTFVLGAGSSLTNVSLGVDDIDPGSLNGAEISTNNTDLEFSAGYFVANGLAISLGFAYENVISKTTDNSYELKNSKTTTTLYPGISYYFGESGVNLKLSYAIGSVKDIEEETGWEDLEQEQSISGLIISAGYSIFVNDIIALTPGFSYNMLSSVAKDAAVNSNGSLTDLELKMSGLSFGFGIAIHFDSY